MNIDSLKQRLPAYARDLRINLGAIASSTALSSVQLWTIAVACARTARSPSTITAVEAEAATQLGPDALDATGGAAAVMGMNNVCYRFVHFTGEVSKYAHMPARLRMALGE